MKRIVVTLSAIAVMALSSQAQAACGSVTISDMNWPSASLLANIDKMIIEHGFGCKAEVVPGDTMPTGASMTEKGEPSIAPEFWANNFKEALATGVKEKRLRIAGRPLLEAEEGFWVPKFLVTKDPSIATIEGVKKNAKLFKHPEDPDKAAFIGCPAGWGCQISAGNLFKALKLEEAGFDLIDPGSAAGLDGSIAKAYERGQGWFGYYWAPTGLLAKYPMVKVDFGSGIDAEHFTSCIAKADCMAPKVTMYPQANVVTITTESFAQDAPEAFAYVSKRGIKNDVIHPMLMWIEENQADGETAAIHFLKSYENVWAAWVDRNAADKIKKAIAGM